MKFFENKRNRGAVSIFLVMILLPTMLLCAVLIDGSRVASARAMTQEAADLAATSALSVYNQKLKDDYGLFAVKEPDKLEKIYKESLEATLLASGLSEDEAYSEKLWGIMKDTVGLNNPYEGKNFLNLYDFKVDSCKVEPKYPLAEKDVLQNQMVEYAKYRGIYIMADRFGILTGKGSVKETAEKEKEATDVMETKMDVDEKNGDADKKIAELMKLVEELNQAVYMAGVIKETYLEDLPAYMEKVKLENTDIEGDYNSNDVSELKGILRTVSSDLQQCQILAKAVLDQAKNTKISLEQAITRLDNFKEGQEGRGEENETIGGLVEDAQTDRSYYQDTCMARVDELLNDKRLEQLAADEDLGNRMRQTMGQIERAVEKYADEIEENDSDSEGEDGETEEEEILEYYYYYLDMTNREENAQTVINGGAGPKKYYRQAVTEVIQYFQGRSWNAVNPAQSRSQNSGQEGKINESVASDQSAKEDESTKPDNGEERKSIKSEYYKDRPSKSYQSAATPEQFGGYWNTSGSLSEAKKALDGSKNSVLLQLGETARDEVLSIAYMFGTFKTRMSTKPDLNGKMSQKEKDCVYMPAWRYAHEDGEIDMRFEPKKDRKTALRSEIEYLVCGKQSDQENEQIIYRIIFAERLANNVYAMYRDKKTIKPACEVAAFAASMATEFVIPERVFFWIFLTAWATAETSLEMHYLLDCGYKIPLFKNNKNIILNEIPDGDGLVDNYGSVNSGVFVTYEDYLLILLLIQGSEKRIMRSADLIEVNMKNNSEESFSMDKAFTYLKADSQMSIRYLFGSTAPFKSDYEANGVTGRIKYNNTIYQGY